MKYIGAHVSASGGPENAIENAHRIGATAFALFVKNQKQWRGKPLTDDQIDSFKKNMETYGYRPEQVLPHAGYLINLANPDEEKWNLSYSSFLDEMQRCEQLGLVYLNIHPGSHLGQATLEESFERIARGINMVLEKTKGVTVVLENTAGQGSSVGHRFDHLAEIIHLVDDQSRIGVCIDTCHTFASGYDLRTRETYESTFHEFEKSVGFKYLKGMHINDSKSEYDSHVDRHHSLGQGNLGLEVFRWIMTDPRFDEIPLILETIDEEIWPDEIEFLKKLTVKGAEMPSLPLKKESVGKEDNMDSKESKSGKKTSGQSKKKTSKKKSAAKKKIATQK